MWTFAFEVKYWRSFFKDDKADGKVVHEDYVK